MCCRCFKTIQQSYILYSLIWISHSTYNLFYIVVNYLVTCNTISKQYSDLSMTQYTWSRFCWIVLKIQILATTISFQLYLRTSHMRVFVILKKICNLSTPNDYVFSQAIIIELFYDYSYKLSYAVANICILPVQQQRWSKVQWYWFHCIKLLSNKWFLSKAIYLHVLILNYKTFRIIFEIVIDSISLKE